MLGEAWAGLGNRAEAVTALEAAEREAVKHGVPAELALIAKAREGLGHALETPAGR